MGLKMEVPPIADTPGMPEAPPMGVVEAIPDVWEYGFRGAKLEPASIVPRAPPISG